MSEVPMIKWKRSQADEKAIERINGNAERWHQATEAVTPESSDNVNHPTHYTSHPSGIEAIEVTRWLSFDLGNSVKYILRFSAAQPKGGQPNIEDLKKARWYLDDEIKRLEGLK